jgi:hypothetical protein
VVYFRGFFPKLEFCSRFCQYIINFAGKASETAMGGAVDIIFNSLGGLVEGNMPILGFFAGFSPVLWIRIRSDPKLLAVPFPDMDPGKSFLSVSGQLRIRNEFEIKLIKLEYFSTKIINSKILIPFCKKNFP